MADSDQQLDHSLLGVASVVIGVGIPLIMAFLFLSTTLLGKGEARKYLGLAALSFAVLAPLQHLIGSILGIGGFFSNKKKLYPVIGTILNMSLGFCGVLLIWLFFEKASWEFR